VPEIRPFRALRYNTSTTGDSARVVAPPYDDFYPKALSGLVFNPHEW
jgi:uncharacterized protein (DUF1015 family)